jgi:hypothetical protein
MDKKIHWVFENDEGKWSLVHDQLNLQLRNSDRKFLVGPGINSAELYYQGGSEKPTHGIASHLEDGMSGYRVYIQYNLKTGKHRFLDCVTWKTDSELEKILQDGSQIREWNKNKTLEWLIKNDLQGYFGKYIN